MSDMPTEEIIDSIRKMAMCLYAEVHASVADYVKRRVEQAASRLEQQAERIKELEHAIDMEYQHGYADGEMMRLAKDKP